MSFVGNSTKKLDLTMKCWWFNWNNMDFTMLVIFDPNKKVSPWNVEEKNAYFSHIFGGFNWIKHDFTWILPCFSWEISLPLERMKWLSPLAIKHWILFFSYPTCGFQYVRRLIAEGLIRQGIKRSWESIYWGGFWRATWIYQSLDVRICVYIYIQYMFCKHQTNTWQ